MATFLLFGLNMIAVFLGVANYDTPAGQLILYGEASNIVVVATNHGKMPVFDASMADATPDTCPDGIHLINPTQANFPFLGDWIIVPTPFGEPVVSPGDVMITVGAVWLLWDKIMGR